jgi:hypothetical protein
MWAFLKYYLTYFKSENISKLLFMPLGIVLYELNRAVHIYSEFDENFTVLITFSFLIGASVNEFRGEMLRKSALVPMKRKQLFIAKILYLLIPAFIYSFFLQLYFLFVVDIRYYDLFMMFFTAKFYIVFIVLFFSIGDLLKTILKWKYLWLFIVPLIVLVWNIVGLFFFVYYFEQQNLGFLLLVEFLFLIMLIPSLFLMYYFFSKRMDYLK